MGLNRGFRSKIWSKNYGSVTEGLHFIKAFCNVLALSKSKKKSHLLWRSRDLSGARKSEKFTRVNSNRSNLKIFIIRGEYKRFETPNFRPAIYLSWIQRCSMLFLKWTFQNFDLIIYYFEYCIELYEEVKICVEEGES